MRYRPRIHTGQIYNSVTDGTLELVAVTVYTYPYTYSYMKYKPFYHMYCIRTAHVSQHLLVSKRDTHTISCTPRTSHQTCTHTHTYTYTQRQIATREVSTVCRGEDITPLFLQLGDIFRSPVWMNRDGKIVKVQLCLPDLCIYMFYICADGP